MYVEEIAPAPWITASPSPIGGSLPPGPDLPEFPECRTCGVPCNREHFATEDMRRSFAYVTHLYCEYCGVGYESLWERVNGRWRIALTAEHRGHKAGPYLERLRALVTA